MNLWNLCSLIYDDDNDDDTDEPMLDELLELRLRLSNSFTKFNEQDSLEEDKAGEDIDDSENEEQ